MGDGQVGAGGHRGGEGGLGQRGQDRRGRGVEIDGHGHRYHFRARLAYNADVAEPAAPSRVRARVRAVAASPAAALVALLLGTYAYFYQAGGWNQNSRFDLVRAMVEDHALRIDRFEKNTGDDSVRAGHHYCDKAPGASWLCTPPYAVMYWLAGSPTTPSPTWLGWPAPPPARRGSGPAAGSARGR